MLKYDFIQRALEITNWLNTHKNIKKGPHHHEALSLNHPKLALATLDLELFCDRKDHTAFHYIGIAINIIINPHQFWT